MLADHVARANRAADSLLGGSSVREFATREFPREDYHWVVASVREAAVSRPSERRRWGRFRRWFGTPGKTELGPEATPEPLVPA
jgi:hypothetical protein